MYSSLLKRSLTASFFVIATCSALSTNTALAAEFTELAKNPTWRSLIQVNKGQPSIKDEAFLLSAADFSAENELSATLALLNQDPTQICAFPARAEWLASQGLIAQPNFNQCPELAEYLTKVPVDSLHLVFSAENLSQPSSMMGHILLMTRGEDAKGQTQEYGITFFTEINAINLPKTLYDTMIKGSQGFFSLHPYSDSLTLYLEKEKRNVWEYELALTDMEKRLIQFHFWELKSKNIQYFFTAYNCATLTNFVLSIANEDLLKQDAWWYTPLDVVKNVHDNDMVRNTVVISSDDWKIRMLTQVLSESQIQSAYAQTPPKQSDSAEQSLLQLELMSALNSYDFNEGNISSTDYIKQQNSITEDQRAYGRYDIQLNDYKTPTKTPYDSKFRYSIRRQGDINRALFSFMPASHELSDDNRQYFAESELKLGQLTLSYDERDKLQLQSFELYNMLTLTPYHDKTGGISGGFSIRYDEQLVNFNRERHYTEFGGQLGLTKELGRGVFLYGLTELTLATDFKKAFASPGLELGILFYSSQATKSIVQWRRKLNSADNGFHYSEVSWEQAFYLNEHFNLKYQQSYLYSAQHSRNDYSLTVEYLF